MENPGQQGQALVESLFAVIVFTSVLFAAVQLALLAVDDIAANEAAFAAMREAAVAPAGRVREAADGTAASRLLRHGDGGRNISGFSTRVWDEDILGHDMKDHQGNSIRKYNVNIDYDVRIMFASLLQPFNNLIFFSGGEGLRRQTARARMVRSPGEDYYGRAWPGARRFDGGSDDGE